MGRFKERAESVMREAAPNLFVLIASALWVSIGLFIANPDMFDHINPRSLAIEFVEFHRDEASNNINGASEALALAILLVADILIASSILKEGRSASNFGSGVRKNSIIVCALAFLIVGIFMPLSQMNFANTILGGVIVAAALIIVRAISYAAPKEFIELSS